MDERDTLRGEDTPDDLVRRMTRKRLIVAALRDWAVEVESRRPKMNPEVSRSWKTLTDATLLILTSAASSTSQRHLEACRAASVALRAALSPQGCAAIPRYVEAAAELAVEHLE